MGRAGQLAVVLAVPAAGVMYGVRHAASSVNLYPTYGGEVALLIELRQLLERGLGPGWGWRAGLGRRRRGL